MNKGIDAMRLTRIGRTRKLAYAFTTSALLVGSMALGTGTASAIDKVGCWGGDYLKITADFSAFPGVPARETHCWANAGEVGVDLPAVTKVSSGNNSGWLAYVWRDGSTGYHSFNHWENFDLGGYKVTRVHIN